MADVSLDEPGDPAACGKDLAFNLRRVSELASQYCKDAATIMSSSPPAGWLARLESVEAEASPRWARWTKLRSAC
jgi:hypothetical protein